jgi:hypothetical protein
LSLSVSQTHAHTHSKRSNKFPNSRAIFIQMLSCLAVVAVAAAPSIFARPDHRRQTRPGQVRTARGSVRPFVRQLNLLVCLSSGVPWCGVVCNVCWIEPQVWSRASVTEQSGKFCKASFLAKENMRSDIFLWPVFRCKAFFYNN